jgi:RNA-directed DNA polymerase
MNDGGKSDRPVLPAKLPNNPADAGAEVVEGRGLPEGNTAREARPGRSAGPGVSSDLDRVRQVARKDRDVRFTALLHHVSVDRLREAYRAISPNAAPGVDGVTWRDYGLDLEANLQELHARVQRGAYRAMPSRRVFIPKPDGRSRPLGVAALEDKILQRAVVEVLNALYEQDFLGFSYGFRPGRGQHDALDALAVAIERRRVNWLLDADIRDFISRLDQGWLERFLEHRIADKRVLRLIQKWLRAGVIEEGEWSETEEGTAQGASFHRCLPTSTCITSLIFGPTSGGGGTHGERSFSCGSLTTTWRALNIVRTLSGSSPIFASGSRSSRWSWRRRRRG